MSERSLFNREGVPTVDAIRNGSVLVPALSYPGKPRSGLPKFLQITFRQGKVDLKAGRKVYDTAKKALEGISS
jgi:hypothetical protein